MDGGLRITFETLEESSSFKLKLVDGQKLTKEMGFVKISERGYEALTALVATSNKNVSVIVEELINNEIHRQINTDPSSELSVWLQEIHQDYLPI